MAFDYTDCTDTMTGIETVSIGGKTFVAPSVVFAFVNPSQPVAITFTYPQVTLTPPNSFGHAVFCSIMALE